MKSVKDLLNELEHHLAHQDMVNRKISSGSVGWHIEHILLTINMVIKGLQASNPASYIPKFDLKRTFVMVTGKIPRGKIKAPAVVQPGEHYNEDSLRQHLTQTRENFESLHSESRDKYFTHPFLGDFRLKPTKRFLQVHTAHHVAIINDILESR